MPKDLWIGNKFEFQRLQRVSRLHTHNFIQSQGNWLRLVSSWVFLFGGKCFTERPYLLSSVTVKALNTETWVILFVSIDLAHFRTWCPVCPYEDKSCRDETRAQRSTSTLCSLVLTYVLSLVSDVLTLIFDFLIRTKKICYINIYSCLLWPMC